MIYPAVIMGVAVIAITVLLWMVIPVFEKTFASVNLALPLPTQIVVGMSRFMNAYFFRDDWRKTWREALGHEMKSDETSFSLLYDLMAAFANTKNRVARYVLKDATLTPLYAALELMGGNGLLRAGASNKEILRLCAANEAKPPELDWLGRPKSSVDGYSYRRMTAAHASNVWARGFTLNFAMDVISTDSLDYQQALVETAVVDGLVHAVADHGVLDRFGDGRHPAQRLSRRLARHLDGDTGTQVPRRGADGDEELPTLEDPPVQAGVPVGQVA